ncbi:MAG: YicC/YloC family endoribonuclease [Burkholderiaceae bacterium]
MTVSSMTGFALARRDHRVGAIVLEIRSVNSRYLDLQFRLSDELRAGEAILREAITAKVSRGKLDVRFYIHRNVGGAENVVASDRMLAQLDGLDRSVRARLPEARPLSVSEVLHWPGVLESGDIEVDEILSLTKGLAADALEQLALARVREGERLATAIVERVVTMEAIALRLQPAVPRLVEAHQQKLEQRLAAALGIVFDGADPIASSSSITRAEALDRIRQEITLYGTRIDVSEELSRLGGHLAEVRAILGRGGVVGKRLDFMMQELNREANTLGSKAAAAELADAAVELKLAIEQIREQVQNLE